MSLRRRATSPQTGPLPADDRPEGPQHEVQIEAECPAVDVNSPAAAPPPASRCAGLGLPSTGEPGRRRVPPSQRFGVRGYLVEESGRARRCPSRRWDVPEPRQLVEAEAPELGPDSGQARVGLQLEAWNTVTQSKGPRAVTMVSRIGMSRTAGSGGGGHWGDGHAERGRPYRSDRDAAVAVAGAVPGGCRGASPVPRTSHRGSPISQGAQRSLTMPGRPSGVAGNPSRTWRRAVSVCDPPTSTWNYGIYRLTR